jgi:hypothetical protein
MAATRTLQNSIDWVRPFLNWANLTIGTGKEPAFTSANQTLQTIVGPPFVWPWNRNTASFFTVIGTQDYTASITDYGYLETATIELAAQITNAVGAAGEVTYTAANNFSTLANGGLGADVLITGCTTAALNGKFKLSTTIPPTATAFTVDAATVISEAESGATAVAGPAVGLELKWGALHEDRALDRPTFIATQLSDLSGTSFTFRLMPVPDQMYRINLIYQKAPVPFVNLSDTWLIPDQLQYLYNYFFAFFMFDYFDDPKAQRYRQLAVAAILARQSGLSATDRNLFIGNWIPLMQEEIEAQTNAQQATQARGL